MRRFLAAIFTRRLVPVWGVLSLALVILAVRQGLNPTSMAPGEINIRGTEVRDLVPLTATAEPPEDRSVRFHWSPVSTADGYALILYAVDLTEVLRLETGPGTEYTLRPEARIARARMRGPLFWRIVALHDGEEIARSRILALEAGP